MKKLLILWMALALALVLSGCQTDKTNDDEDDQATDQVEQEQDDTEDAETSDEMPEGNQEQVDETSEPATDEDGDMTQTVMENFESILASDYDASYLGMFIEEHISQASEAEAEEMLFWLYIYQTEFISYMNDKMYGPDYSYTERFMDALYTDLQGELNPDKLGKVKDEEIQKDLSDMIAGYTTIVRYEETAVVETDWERLAAFAPYTSEEFGAMLNLRGNYMSRGYSEDFYSMCETVVMLEATIPDIEDPFVKWHMNRIHDFIVGDLLVGPEGSHIGIFFDDSYYMYYEDLYDQLMAFAADYYDTDFGAMLTEIDQIEWNDDWGAFIDFVYAYGYDVDSIFSWNREDAFIGEVAYERIVLTSEQAPEIADAVNATIEMAISTLISSVSDIADYSIYMYLSHSDDKYASISLSLSYMDANGTYMYVDRSLNFDLETGMEITLSDFLGIEDDEVLDVLKEMTGISYSIMPTMEIYEQSVNLRTDENDANDIRYTQLTLKDLAPYIDVMTLFN